MTRPLNGRGSREPVRYSGRVIRTIEQSRDGAARALVPLMDNTQAYVEYEKPGKIGVTLLQLDPVIRSILGKDRRGVARLDGKSDFENELNANLKHAQYDEYSIPVAEESQLGIYGRDEDVLGLRLSTDDYRLVGDHAVVKQYVDNTYAHLGGESARARFLQANSGLDLGYVALGRIRYENMSSDQRSDFRAGPTEFLELAAEVEMESNQERFGGNYKAHEIVFPDVVAFNGLSVACHQIS